MYSEINKYDWTAPESEVLLRKFPWTA